MAADKSAGAWPEWPRPGGRTLLALVKKVTPFVRFLDPEIVAAIVKDNRKQKKRWSGMSPEKSAKLEAYLWKDSACAFPGIRRHAGKKELSSFNRTSEAGDLEDALAIDGNTYPKQIWSFILRGKKFQNSGPPGYSLAHLADHKAYKNRLPQEFDAVVECPSKLHGLFTAASNTVYRPDNLLRLTDFNQHARLLLLNRAQELYGGVCNIVPPGLTVKRPPEKWAVGEFEWGDPVTAASPSYVQEFLDFRNETIAGLLSE